MNMTEGLAFVAAIVSIFVPIAGFIWYIINHGSERKKIFLASLISLLVMAILLLTVNILSRNPNGTFTSTTAQANDDATPQAINDATSTAQGIASNSYPSYLPGRGTLAFVDPLNQASGSQWSSNNNSGGACQFSGDAYHISAYQSNLIHYCNTSAAFSNFAFEMQSTITQGDCGGMFFRLGSDSNGDYRYYFRVCQNGSYDVSKYDSHSGSTDLGSGNSSAIHSGLGEPNKIALVANGSSFAFYVNEQQVSQLQDSSYTSGYIALIAGDYGQVTDVAYSNAKLWTL